MFRFALIISFCLLAAPLYAFEQIATLKVNKHSAQIGEPIELQINLKIDKNDILFSNGKLTPPAPLELVGNVEIDSSDEYYYREYDIKAKVTSFDEGNIEIGPFYFGSSQSVVSNSETVDFTAPAVDTSRGFRDIKPPLTPKRGFWDNLPYALFIVIVLLVGFYFYRRLTKKSKIEVSAPKAIVPPYDLALRRLRELQNSEAGEIKVFFTELSFILKDYFSEVWHANALEATTEELLEMAGKYNLSERAKTNLKYALQLSDLVKFAKLKPSSDVISKAVQTAIEFVESTREYSVGFNLKETKHGV